MNVIRKCVGCIDGLLLESKPLQFAMITQTTRFLFLDITSAMVSISRLCAIMPKLIMNSMPVKSEGGSDTQLEVKSENGFRK